MRPAVLDGLSVLVAGAGGTDAGVADRLAALGARVRTVAIDPAGDPPAADTPAVLVWDGEDAVASAAGVAGVHAALDGAWLAIRAAIAGGSYPGRIVLLAPRPGDAHREAARAGLENLARTLGIEWARFGVRAVTVLPGAVSAPAQLAEIVAYLASPAGDYFSGCRLELHAA